MSDRPITGTRGVAECRVCGVTRLVSYRGMDGGMYPRCVECRSPGDRLHVRIDVRRAALDLDYRLSQRRHWQGPYMRAPPFDLVPSTWLPSDCSGLSHRTEQWMTGLFVRYGSRASYVAPIIHIDMTEARYPHVGLGT